MKTPKKSGGLYARLMGDFHVHEKVIGLSLEAIGLWTVLVSWSAGRRRDGVFSEAQLRGVAGARPYKKPFAELLRVRLVDEIEGGDFCLHDWSDHNMTRQEHDTGREAERIRKAEARAAAQVGNGGCVRPDNQRKSGGNPANALSLGLSPISRPASAERGVKGLRLVSHPDGYPFGPDDDGGLS